MKDDEVALGRGRLRRRPKPRGVVDRVEAEHDRVDSVRLRPKETGTIDPRRARSAAGDCPRGSSAREAGRAPGWAPPLLHFARAHRGWERLVPKVRLHCHARFLSGLGPSVRAQGHGRAQVMLRCPASRNLTLVFVTPGIRSK